MAILPCRPSTPLCPPKRDTCAPEGRERRIFWATQPDACAPQELCPDAYNTSLCGTPGLQLIEVCDEVQMAQLGCHAPCQAPPIGRTIVTANWVEGLLLNILGTDMRRDDDECGHLPGRRGGHWTDSFRSDNLLSGTRLRHISPNCSVVDMISQVQAAIDEAGAKLMQWGVARSVTVAVTYRGRNTLQADISIIGESGERLRVGLSGSRLANGYVWASQRLGAMAEAA